MDNSSTDNRLLQRYLALKLLRENIHFSEPNKYNSLDFLDDVPGKLRTTAGLFNDVPPSLAIISRDPEKRKAQIRAALHKIKHSKESKSELGKQMLDNSIKMGLGSVPISFLLSSAIQLMGFRGIRGANNKLRLPFSPVSTTKSILKNKPARKEFLTQGLSDAAVGGLLGGASGAAVPLLSGKTKLPEDALNDAASVLQEQPYISSFPIADALSVLRKKEIEEQHPTLNVLKNTALGAVGGAALGGLAGATSPWFETPKLLWSAVRDSGFSRNALQTMQSELKDIVRHKMPINARRTALPMAIAGAALGALTKNLQKNEAESIKSNLA